MPIATSFGGGRGNGFRVCPVNWEVSGFDYWTTLGGFNHDSGGTPSQAEIDLSLANAMKLYWNFYGATLSVSADTAVVNNIDVRNDARAEPSSRVCGGLSPVEKSDQKGEAEFGFDVYYADVKVVVSILRYTLSGEFIGYGLDTLVTATAFDINTDDSVALRLLGFRNTRTAAEVSLVSVSDIPFLCAASAGGDDADADPANLSASTSTLSASITSLDFYDY